MYSHDPQVTGSNPGRVELGESTLSVQVKLEQQQQQQQQQILLQKSHDITNNE